MRNVFKKKILLVLVAIGDYGSDDQNRDEHINALIVNAFCSKDPRISKASSLSCINSWSSGLKRSFLKERQKICFILCNKVAGDVFFEKRY